MSAATQIGCRGFVFSTQFVPAFNEWLVGVRPWAYLEGNDRESETYYFLDAAEWAIGQNVLFDIVQGNFAPDIANPVQVGGF